MVEYEEFYHDRERNITVLCLYCGFRKGRVLWEW